ncbi:MAG: protein kinase [Deltaproteobacteria bacterium]|nr:protein kinase [Deltaproteobacteria bacterium]
MTTPRATARPPNWPDLGKYEILTEIGAGGMATVYLARQRGPQSFEKLVVVKTIHPHLAKQEHFVNMFLDEARIAAQINHPNVIQVYDLGIENDTYFIVMEYLQGEPLNSVLETSITRSTPLPPQYGARIVARVAEGLHAAHELTSMTGDVLDVVHRDVTPGNIIVNYDGRVKVVDFGVAKARGRLTQTEGGQLKGKLSYMSPEQIEGDRVDRRSDIFAAGVVLWEVLAVRRLFRHSSEAAVLAAIFSKRPKPPSHFRPSVPAALDAIALRALEKDPANRYQTAREMQIELDAASAPHATDPDLSRWMDTLFADRASARKRAIAQVVEAANGHFAADSSGIRVLLRDEDSGSLSLPGKSAVTSTVQCDRPTTPPDLAGDTDAYEVNDAPSPEAQAHSRAPARPVGGSPRFPAGKQGIVAALGVTLLAGLGLMFALKPTANDRMSSGSNPTDGRTVAVSPKAVLPDLPGAAEPRPEALPAPTPEADAGGTAESAPAPAGAAPARQTAKRQRKDEAKTDTPRTTAKKPVDAAEAKRLFDEATRLYLRGKLDDAERSYKGALAADPAFAPAYRALGLLHQRRGNRALAIKNLRAYLNLSPWAEDAEATQARLKELAGTK